MVVPINIHDHNYADFSQRSSWIALGGVAICVTGAAFAAGLTVGLMSLDPLEMEIKRRVGTPVEKRCAETICPLISRHHLLLVTLLLFNSLANEALPIFLSDLVPDYVAVLLSVTLVLFFGEIIPSAIFTGPRQTKILSYLSGLVYLLMAVFYPFAKPIAWILDKCLGEHGLKRYTREELSALVELQREYGAHRRMRATTRHGHGHDPIAISNTPLHHTLPITMDEATIVAGVLKCHSKTVADVMTPIDEVFSLNLNDVLDEEAMAQIVAQGFSRIPVHDKSRRDLRGFLLVKRLIVLDPEDCRPVRTLPLRRPIVVAMNQSLLELLNIFQEGRSHLAFVAKRPDLTRKALEDGKELMGDGAPIGIITLEDLFEEILQEQIYDEDDGREKKALESLRRIRREVRQQAAKAATGILPLNNGDPQRQRLITTRPDGHTLHHSYTDFV